MELNSPDLRRVIRMTPKAVLNLMKERGLILAGGAIRNIVRGDPASDLDLFAATQETLKDAAHQLVRDWGADRIWKTENAWTVFAQGRHPVQFIMRWKFGNPEDCIKSFDFTACQAAVWFADGRWLSATAKSFYADCASRRLTYTSPEREEEAAGSMMRVRKFLAKGWHIDAENLAAVMARVFAKIDLEAVEEPDGGWQHSKEARLAFVISGLLREVDPLTPVDGLEAAEEKDEEL